MTSLIQACKILTALLALNNPSSLLCRTPFRLTSLHLSTPSLFPSASSSSFYTPSYLAASMFLPERRQLKYEVSINPVAGESSHLLSWLLQARWWEQRSDWNARTLRHCTFTCAVGQIRWQETGSGLIGALVPWLMHTHTHARTHAQAQKTHIQTLTQLQLPQSSQKGEANAEGERERVNVNLSVWSRDRRG